MKRKHKATAIRKKSYPPRVLDAKDFTDNYGLKMMAKIVVIVILLACLVYVIRVSFFPDEPPNIGIAFYNACERVSNEINGTFIVVNGACIIDVCDKETEYNSTYGFPFSMVIRNSGLRKKGQLVKLKPTLFFSRAESKVLLSGFSKGPAMSLAEHIEGLIRAKSYPSGRPATSSRTDNFAIWIEGKRCLEDLIMAQEASSDQEIAAINDRLQRFHTKNVKGHTYWYMSDGNSGHKYIGREDPSPACLEEIKVIKERDQEIIELKTLRELSAQGPAAHAGDG